jgi:hypothetical protein
MFNIIDSVAASPSLRTASTISTLALTGGTTLVYGHPALQKTIAVAEEMAIYHLAQDNWTAMLAHNPELADQLEEIDLHICPISQLADLIVQAPNSTIRQVLREVFYCRHQLALALDLAFDVTGAELSIFDDAEAEWTELLSAHPTFASWLGSTDRFTCPRASLVDGMRFAPTPEIRQALRELFCFRETVSLATSHSFD